LLNVGQLLYAVEVIHRRAHAEVAEKLALQELQHRSAPKNYLQHLPLLAAEIVCGFLGPPRGFEESIELQTANWGMRRVPHLFRPQVKLPFECTSKSLRVRVLAALTDATDVELQQEAEACGAEFIAADHMGARLHKDRRLVKRWASTHSGTGQAYKFYAPPSTVRRIPRIFGPQLHRMGAFPEVVKKGELQKAIDGARRLASFRLKASVMQRSERPIGLSACVGHVGLQFEDAFVNVAVCVNALYGKLEEQRSFMKFGHPFQTVAVKTTMGQPVYVVRHGIRERTW